MVPAPLILVTFVCLFVALIAIALIIVALPAPLAVLNPFALLPLLHLGLQGIWIHEMCLAVMCERGFLNKFGVPWSTFYIGVLIIIALSKNAISVTPTGVSGIVLNAHCFLREEE